MDITSGGRSLTKDFFADRLLKLEYYKVVDNMAPAINKRFEIYYLL